MDNPLDIIQKINELRQITNSDFALVIILFIVTILSIGFLYIRYRIAKENDKREIINTVQEMLLNDSKQYKIHIENEVKEQKSEINKLKEERIGLLRRIELLEIELRYANIQIDNNRQSQNKLEEMHTRLENLQKMLDDLKAELIQVKEDNEQLNNKLSQKNEYINALESQIVKLKEELKNERDERLNASTYQFGDDIS